MKILCKPKKEIVTTCPKEITNKSHMNQTSFAQYKRDANCSLIVLERNLYRYFEPKEKEMDYTLKFSSNHETLR